MKYIKEHFENEANIFDKQVVNIVPHYVEMLDALVTAIPFSQGRIINVADLGCGTGSVSFLIKKRFPKAHITCIDMSENMLILARQKMKGLRNIKFESGELSTYSFKEKFDVVVSSLALHHLTDKEKSNMRWKVFNTLAKGGIFINADIIISSDNALQTKYLKKWGEFILRNYTKQQLHENHRKYLKEDIPSDIFKELTDLKTVGFSHIEILWKYYNFAVYCAGKKK